MQDQIPLSSLYKPVSPADNHDIFFPFMSSSMQPHNQETPRQPGIRDLGAKARFPKLPTAGSETSFRDSQLEITPATSIYEEQITSEADFSTHSRVPLAEASRMDNERGIGRMGRLTDYEIFLAQSRAEFEQERNWARIEIENESIHNKDGNNRSGDDHPLKSIRFFLRIFQVCVRWGLALTVTDFSSLVFALINVTAANVRQTENILMNEMQLWPTPTLLWPEYFIMSAAAASLSFSLSRTM